MLNADFMAEAAGLLCEELAIVDWYLINDAGCDFQDLIIAEYFGRVGPRRGALDGSRGTGLAADQMPYFDHGIAIPQMDDTAIAYHTCDDERHKL